MPSRPGPAREEEPALPLKKILAISFCCAGLYAAVIGGASLAQDPTPSATGTPASTQTPAPTVFSTPTSTPTVPDADGDVDPDADGHADRLLHALQHAHDDAHPVPLARADRRGAGRHARSHAHGHARSSRPGRARAEEQEAPQPQERLGQHHGSRLPRGQAARPRRPDRRRERSVDLDHSFRVRPARVEGAGDVLAGDTPRATERADGVPTPSNPNYALATPGAAPIGVPNFFIDKFRIPPFLLPIYQAAGIEYGVRWEVLAAINEIETDYGRNLNVSSAGALGLDAVHAADLEGVRRRRQPRRPQGPVQPGRRDLRRRPLPARRRRRDRHPQGDLRVQPRRLVRRLRPHARPSDRRPALQLRRLAHRA